MGMKKYCNETANGIKSVLKDREELNCFSGYDFAIANCHISNCGYTVETVRQTNWLSNMRP